jgi:hypothetical protein
MDSDLPWYHAGLRFTCTQCGDCCTGAPGHVWVTNDEIDALARHLGMSADAFEDAFVRRVGARKSLKELPTGDCVLLDDKRACSAYSARPRQCRTWPFWNSNLKSEQDWVRTCEVCPGSGRGHLHTLSQIEAQRQVIDI